MAFEVPHKHDISLDGQEMRNQMIENFEAIEHEDQQDDQALVEEIQDRGDADKKLDDKIATEAQARKAGDHALDHKYAAEIDQLDQADSDIKSLITSVEKRLNVRIDDLASDMRAADESNLAAMTAKAERVAVGSDGPTFIRMLGWALHDPKIRDVVANIVKE